MTHGGRGWDRSTGRGPARLVPPALLVLTLALGLGAAGRAQTDALGRLQLWLDRVRLSPRSVDERRQAELRSILGDLRVLRASQSGEVEAVDLGLVELASLEWRETRLEDPELIASARLGRAELEAELRRDPLRLGASLAKSVLASGARRSRAERLMATRLLEGAHVPATLEPLTTLARTDDAELRGAAQAALSGWPSQAVDAFFLEELQRDAPSTRRAAEHFQSARKRLDARMLSALQQETARRYLDEDWREGARARGLVRSLDTARAVPILIEALAVWQRRGEAGTGSRRILGEIVQELQRISGRAIGPEPERWSDWWQAVRAGRIELPADIAAAGGQSSSATFFGLRAVTDRVVFVVDRSTSMRTAFGTGGQSRHEEAIGQLVSFLEKSGEDTRFTVALFSDTGTCWRSRLTAATSTNLEQVRRWLEGKPPEGETRLFEGVRAGLGLDGRGRLLAERCEADTVIVLCDGATTEGPGWVAEWLASQNEDAQLVFHCVQIGSGGNGTLEALAEGSGGEFVRVNG